MKYKILCIDNFGKATPEYYVIGLPLLSESHAERICMAINEGLPFDYDRYYQVVPEDYKLIT